MRASVREVFAAAAGSYGRGNPLLGMERAEMAGLWPDPGGMDVLDVGAGTGYYAAWAAARGARRAVALDCTPEMLAAGARLARGSESPRLPAAPATGVDSDPLSASGGDHEEPGEHVPP